ECDLRLECERRVAAGEDQLEALVGEAALVCHLVQNLGHGDEMRLRRERALAPDPVDGLVACRRDEPGAGIRRDAVSGPPFCGDRERLLGGFFGAVEIAEEAGEGRNDTSPLIAEDLPGQCSTRGRTSTAPCRAPGMRAAKEIASSRLSASSR